MKDSRHAYTNQFVVVYNSDIHKVFLRNTLSC